jgi:hypothetical protein
MNQTKGWCLGNCGPMSMGWEGFFRDVTVLNTHQNMWLE